MMLANAIQEGNQAMIKNVEEVSECFVVVRRALQDQLGTWGIESAKTAGEAEEVDGHLGRRGGLFARGNVFPARDLSDVAGRKIQFDFRSEVNDFLRGIRALSRWDQAISSVNDLKQTNGLEKVKAVSFGEEP